MGLLEDIIVTGTVTVDGIFSGIGCGGRQCILACVVFAMHAMDELVSVLQPKTLIDVPLVNGSVFVMVSSPVNFDFVSLSIHYFMN